MSRKKGVEASFVRASAGLLPALTASFPQWSSGDVCFHLVTPALWFERLGVGYYRGLPSLTLQPSLTLHVKVRTRTIVTVEEKPHPVHKYRDLLLQSIPSSSLDAHRTKS